MPRCLFVPVAAVLTVLPAHAQTPPALTPSDYASRDGARAIAAADFDNDGWIDLAHANAGRDTVSILRNGRDGRSGFTHAGEVPVGRGPFAVVTADFNLDGRADLAVANADDDTISILLGQGDATFSHTRLAAPGNPRAIASADMNRDGRPDLIYTGHANNRVQVLVGDGSGGFSAMSAQTGHASRPQGVTAADFNRDGIMDLAVAYAGGGGLAVLTFNAAGAPTARSVAGPGGLNVVAAADINTDGWQDVVSASTSGNQMAVYLGGPDGLRHAATYATGNSPRGIVVADVDHDGRLDVATANRWASSVSVFIRQADGAFAATEYPAGAGSRDLALGDFDADGRTDLATGNQDGANATVLWNDTPLVPAAFAFERREYPTGGHFSGVAAVGDVNHNGLPDLLSREYITLDGAAVVRFSGQNFYAHDIADFNGDGHPDLLGRSFTDWNEWRGHIMLGNGRGEFSRWQDLPTSRHVGYVAAADMNRDGRRDVVATTSSGDGRFGLEVILAGPGGTWSAASYTDLPTWAIGLQVADLNGDGRPDVAIHHYDPKRLDVYPGNGDGTLGVRQEHVFPHYVSELAVGDVNQDGFTDLVAVGWFQVLVLDGSPSGPRPARTVADIAASTLAVADMNADGRLDILLGYASMEFGQTGSRLLFGDGQGNFSPPSDFAFDIYHFLVADMNLDGLPDVVTDGIVFDNLRTTTNRDPVITQLRGFELEYAWQFEDEGYEMWAEIVDPDAHAVQYEWRNGEGELLSRGAYFLIRFPPGKHEVTLTVRDGRGGSASQTVPVTIRPTKEVVISPEWWWSSSFWPRGSWVQVADDSAAAGTRYHDPNRNAAKASAPLAAPDSYLHVGFVADPTQVYKIWIRLKAENNYWGNDSVFVQFSGATDVDGNPVHRTGTTSGLDVNLEECSGCGISGWGWRDERWGSYLHAQPLLLRFPEGGFQQLIVQTREDGVSLDQIVLSAEKYLTAPPGAAKNDTTIVRPPW